jgi:hypothetical protein
MEAHTRQTECLGDQVLSGFESGVIDLPINRECLKTRRNSLSDRFLCAGCVPESNGSLADSIGQLQDAHGDIHHLLLFA